MISAAFINIVGFIALVINLYSMSAKGEYKLRVLSLIANSIYILYGIMISALPVIIGCIIAVFLHAYHINRIRLDTNCK